MPERGGCKDRHLEIGCNEGNITGKGIRDAEIMLNRLKVGLIENNNTVMCELLLVLWMVLPGKGISGL
jgi:hypothetical protein